MKQHTLIKISEDEGKISCINIDYIVLFIYDAENDKIQIELVNGVILNGDPSDELKQLLELK